MKTFQGAQYIAAQPATDACENALIFSVNMRENSAKSRALGIAPAAIARAVR